MTDRSHPSPHAAPARPAAAEVQRLLSAETALPSRLRYGALLLAGLAAATITGSLLATEPGLPARTRIAFGVMTGIGLAWAAYAVWVLSRRHVLLASHRIVAGRMAVAFTSMFTAGALAVALLADGGPAAFAAAGVGLLMLAVAGLTLAHAHQLVARLTARRDAIEQQLAASAGTR